MPADISGDYPEHWDADVVLRDGGTARSGTPDSRWKSFATAELANMAPSGGRSSRLSLLIFDNSRIIIVSARGVFLWDGQ